MEQASHPDGVDPLIGTVVDERYRIEALLGQGGIGRVYEARHATLGKRVALKVLLTRYESVPVLKQRFQREAEALAALSHPNIVTVTDYGVSGSMPYIVMELLEGEDLHERLLTGEPLPVEQALSVSRQMLRALAHAHEQGLVHRDLKPHNVFVRSLGGGDVHVEVLDFGLARFVTDAYKDAPKLTAQGALLGTPAYMAPEQARGEDADARADVYAAGCVIFEALTGRRVFEGRDSAEILRAHLLSPPPTLAQADPGLEVDPGLEALLQRCLEKSPSARYAHAGELLAALDALGPRPLRRVGPRPALAASPSGVAPTQPPVSAPTAAATPRARAEAARPTAPSDPVRLPQRKTPLILGGGCAALLLMGLGAGGVYYLYGPPSADDAAAEPPPPSDAAPPSPAPSAPAPPADPFAGDVPPLLLEVYEAIESGERVPRARANAVSEFARDHPADPRPHVLLGHLNVDAGRWRMGLTEYQTAVEIDARVRGDPQMLPRAFVLVRRPETRAAATGWIREVWGAEALEPLGAALQQPMPSAEQTALEVLRDSLGPGRAASGGPRR